MFTKTEEIRIETSTICNYNCLVCPRDSLKRKKEIMSNDLFDLILSKKKDELPHIKKLTISGFGEFSIDKDWKYKIKKASILFDKIHIITNLSLLSEPDLSFLLNYISDIRVSLYGFTEDIYNKIHNTPANNTKYFNNIVKKIFYIIKLKNKNQKIILNYIEIPENKNETKDWINFWKDKVNLIEVWKPHNWINGKKYRSCCTHRIKTCGRPFTGPIQVQVDGTINVCCFDYNGELLIGDLKNSSFNKIFNSDKMQNIQNLHRNNKADLIHQCSICDQRNCNKCKSKEMIFNSKFSIEKRIQLTSTEYDKLY
jgi:hypothetical protein